jgi:hypothetical protein
MMKPLKLSGGALNLPNLESNDCPLPNLQIYAAYVTDCREDLNMLKR